MKRIKGWIVVFLLISVILFFLVPTNTSYRVKNITVEESTATTSDSGTMEVIWYRTWDGSSSDSGYSICSNGGYLYALGHTYSFGARDKDFALVKWDTNGNIVWNRTWGGTGFDRGYSICSNGGYLYALGETDSFGSGRYDLALIKWDTNGNIVWNRTWGGTGFDRGYSICSNGDYLYTLGYTCSFGAGASDFALVKWDTNGNIIWNQTWGGIVSDCGLSICSNGDYLYTLGYTCSFGAGASDFALVKWDTNGNIIWNQTWGGTDRDVGRSICSNGGYLYTLGETKSLGSGGKDLALIKWDTNGNIVWNRTWGKSDGESGHSICSNGDYLYTLGYTCSFGAGASDFALVKWDTDGNIIWGKTWGGTAGDYGRSICSNRGCIYTLGYTFSFGAGGQDFALVKWDTGTIAFSEETTTFSEKTTPLNSEFIFGTLIWVIVIVGVLIFVSLVAIVATKRRSPRKPHYEIPALEPHHLALRSSKKEKGKRRLFKKKSCMICWSALKSGQDIVFCPHCKSPAHREHLLEWLHMNDICPRCKKPLKENNL